MDIPKMRYNSRCVVTGYNHEWIEIFKVGAGGLSFACCKYCGAEWVGLEAEWAYSGKLQSKFPDEGVCQGTDE